MPNLTTRLTDDRTWEFKQSDYANKNDKTAQGFCLALACQWASAHLNRAKTLKKSLQVKRRADNLRLKENAETAKERFNEYANKNEATRNQLEAVDHQLRNSQLLKRPMPIGTAQKKQEMTTKHSDYELKRNELNQRLQNRQPIAPQDTLDLQDLANKAKAARDIYVQARKTDLDNDSADLKNEKNRLANAAIAGTVDGVAISSAEKTLLTHYGLKVMKASQGALDTTTLRDLLETGKCYVINMKNDKGGHALALYLSHGRLGWKTLRRCYLFDPNFGEFRQGVALISTLLGELISSQYTAGFGKFTMWEVAKHP